MTDGKMLEEKIRQSGLKKGFIAERLGISRATFRALLNNQAEFKASQIRVLCDLLDIRDEETMMAIFFATSVA